MNKINVLKKLNWTNTVFLILTPIIGLAGTLFLTIDGRVHTGTLILAFVWLFASGLAITAGYHRLFAHSTYKTKAIVRILFLLFGAAAFEGSAMEWCTDHRNHHRYTDTEKDPYNIKKGFWYAHIGWLFMLDANRRNYDNVEDLSADKWVRLATPIFCSNCSIMGFGVPMLIALLWHDPFGGLILAGVFRTAINNHFTFCISSVSYFW